MRDAAEWLAHLNARTVSVAQLRAFRRWRRDPRNDAAFRKLQALWRLADGLVDDPDIIAATEAAKRQR
ncbi:FecR/PupR family sigma factor regulator [Phenylobacterium sp.]|uniref:FecR/PupR family sigma factor regulator n=1 Tax=Phenylobacterium sp. TaxID=1871053 RepID=UPI0035B0ED06